MQGSDFAYDSFIRVGPRKKRRGKNQRHASTTPSDLLARVNEELTTDGRWSLDCQEMFQKALHFARIKPQRVLCLGLGSPSSSRDARAQLAFLVRLCDSSDIGTENVSVYDPVFTEADGQLFGTLAIQLLDPIQGAEYSVDGPTILYMPHCELRLYENVIRANWTLDGLCNIVFVANRFGDYADSRQLEKECPFLSRLVPFIESRPLPTSRAFPNAFNNLSIQYVSRTPLSQQGHIFWDVSPHTAIKAQCEKNILGYKAD